MCSQKILLLVYMFAFSFPAAHFHPVGRKHVTFSHHRFSRIFMLFLQRDTSPLFLSFFFFISRISFFSVIHVSVDMIKI